MSIVFSVIGYLIIGVLLLAALFDITRKPSSAEARAGAIFSILFAIFLLLVMKL